MRWSKSPRASPAYLAAVGEPTDFGRWGDNDFRVKTHPLAGAILTITAVVAFRGGRVGLELHKHDAKSRVDGLARLTYHGQLPAADANILFLGNHPRCFHEASAWSLREVKFDARRYTSCLDDVAARHWSERLVTLAGGVALEQDPYFPGAWRTYVDVSGDVPPAVALRYDPDCDGTRLPGPTSNVMDRSGGRGDGGARRAELVIPKLFSRQCAGNATIKVSALIGDWLLGIPLVIKLPREAELQGR